MVFTCIICSAGDYQRYEIHSFQMYITFWYISPSGFQWFNVRKHHSQNSTLHCLDQLYHSHLVVFLLTATWIVLSQIRDRHFTRGVYVLLFIFFITLFLLKAAYNMSPLASIKIGTVSRRACMCRWDQTDLLFPLEMASSKCLVLLILAPRYLAQIDITGDEAAIPRYHELVGLWLIYSRLCRFMGFPLQGWRCEGIWAAGS